MVRLVWLGSFVSAIGALMLLVGCSKNRDNHDVLLISHAGMGLNIQNSFYHDNSREAVEMAYSMIGCDGVEVDVQLSKDGELWLYHDPELSSETFSSNCIPSYTSQELSEVRYRTIKKERLCRLTDLSPDHFFGKKLFLDLKHFNACSLSNVDLDTMILRISELSLDSDQLYVITNFGLWVEPLKKAGLSVLLQLNDVSHISSNNFLADGFIIRNTLLNSEQVKEIKETGKKLFIFDVRSPKGIRSALDKHPDGVITDDIRASIIEKN